MKTGTDRSAWRGDIRLNGFVPAFQVACSKLAAGEAEVCTLPLTLTAEDRQIDARVYVVPADSVVHQVIEDALSRVITDETVVRGISLRRST